MTSKALPAALPSARAPRMTSSILLAFVTEFGFVISTNLSMIVELPHLTTGRGLRYDEATPAHALSVVLTALLEEIQNGTVTPNMRLDKFLAAVRHHFARADICNEVDGRFVRDILELAYKRAADAAREALAGTPHGPDLPSAAR